MSNKNTKILKEKRSIESAENEQINSESSIHAVTPAKKIKQDYNPNDFIFEHTPESLSHLESLYSANKTVKNDTASNNLVDKKGKITEITGTAYTCTLSGVVLIAGLALFNAYAIKNFVKGQETFNDRFELIFTTASTSF